MSHPTSPGNLARGALRGLIWAAVVLACSAATSPSRTPAAAPRPAASSPPPLVFAPVHIHGMTYDRPRHSLVLTITGPVTISTRVLKSPARLVVDIPNTSLDSANRELVVKDELVTRVRVSQFKILPPTVRVVIETATEAEPLIAVQQTGKRLYITLAPARPGEAEQPEGVLPSPGPEPSDFTPPTVLEGSPAPARPSPVVRPVATPTPWRPAATPTPWRPAATPTPAWRPASPVPSWLPPAATPAPGASPRNGINTRLRPGMPIPTPRRSATPAPAVSPGGEWRDLFPTPAPTRRPTPAPATPTPQPFWTPPVGTPATPGVAEPTPVPPPRGTEETGNETWPSVP